MFTVLFERELNYINLFFCVKLVIPPTPNSFICHELCVFGTPSPSGCLILIGESIRTHVRFHCILFFKRNVCEPAAEICFLFTIQSCDLWVRTRALLSSSDQWTIWNIFDEPALPAATYLFINIIGPPSLGKFFRSYIGMRFRFTPAMRSF